MTIIKIATTCSTGTVGRQCIGWMDGRMEVVLLYYCSITACHIR